MKRFNLRVYGILINDRDEVLLSYERRKGFAFVKFPGGGLEWGEGTVECLQREFREELGIEITAGELFYLTDFFQLSAFHPDDQLLSVYYMVNYPLWESIPIAGSLLPETDDYEVVRWVPRNTLSSETVTFPIDQLVCERLASQKMN